jgi:hypothetical protein
MHRLLRVSPCVVYGWFAIDAAADGSPSDIVAEFRQACSRVPDVTSQAGRRDFILGWVRC